jgi:itaconyl-CoA hydratase
MPGKKKQIIQGWGGRFYEDFEVGHVYRSAYGRTVTELDNSMFTHLTMNTNPMHFDAQFVAQTKWKKILVNSTFTLSLIVGMSVPDVSQNAMANLGWDEIKLSSPVFVGDTVYCETEVLSKRESNSYPEAGIVQVRSRGINQDGKVVITFKRSVMVYKKDAHPGQNLFPTADGE